MVSTKWTDKDENSTDWSDSSGNSTNWTDTVSNSVNWSDGLSSGTKWADKDKAYGVRLLENGDDRLMETSADRKLQ